MYVTALSSTPSRCGGGTATPSRSAAATVDA